MSTTFRSARWAAMGLVMFLAGPRAAFLSTQQPANSQVCNQPLPESVTFVKLGMGARFVQPSWDGCWVFVTAHNPEIAHAQFPNGRPGLAVLRRSGGTIEQVRFVVVPEFNGTPQRAWGMNLTRDQKVLAVGGNRQVAFFDVQKLISGQSDPVLGAITDNRFGDVGVGMALTSDDKYLFVPQRASNWLTIIDLEKARAEGFNAKAIVGGIPTGAAGLALLSPDERRLYLMNTSAPPSMKWPQVCYQPESDKVTEGLLQVIDVKRALSGSPSAVLASASLGCGASRMAASPDGTTLYVAGGPVLEGTRIREESLAAFDLRPVDDGSDPKLIGRVSIGRRPVTGTAMGVTLIDGGRKAAMTHIAHSKSAVIAVIDTVKMAGGADALLGVIPAAFDPTNVAVSADGRSLFSAALESQTLVVADLERMQEFLRPPSELDGPPQPPALPGHVTQYDPRRDADKDIRNAVTEAQKSGKRILLEVGGDWCSWCHVLDRLFEQNPALTALRDRYFITVKINFSPDNENKAVLSRYPKIQGYPHIFVLDADGMVLLSQGTSEFEEKDTYNPQRFTAFFEKWAPRK